MASSSHISTSRSTSPTYRHSRIADAVQVAPYLTHVVRHHGQVTLIPPENSGRIRKPKKKRPVVREYLSSSFDLPRTSAPRSRSRASRPGSSNSIRSLQTDANDVRRDTDLEARVHRSREDLCIPSFPPPSFEEAMLSTPSPRNSSPGSLVDTQPSVDCILSSERDTVREQASSPTIPVSREDLPPSPDVEGPRSSSSHSSFEVALQREGHSQWEEDREAGFSLEERVQRELERRQLSDSLPHAPSMHDFEQNDSSPFREEVEAEAGPSFRKVDEATLVPQANSCLELMLNSSHAEVKSISDLPDCEQLARAPDSMPSSSSRDVTAAGLGGSNSNGDIPHLPSGKGKEKEHSSDEPAFYSSSSGNSPSREPRRGTVSRIREVLNAPLRPQLDNPHTNINSMPIPFSPPPQSSEQFPSIEQSSEPLFSSHNSSTLLSVSSSIGNSICTHTLTNTTPRSPPPQSEISSHIPPIASSSPSATTLPSSYISSPPASHSSRPLPTPPGPSLATSSPGSSLPARRIPPLPPSVALSVRDRISVFESLTNRPVPPPPPPLRPIVRRPPPPVPRPPNAVSAQDFADNRNEGQDSAPFGPAIRHINNSAPLLPVRRGLPPPLPPRRRQGLDNLVLDEFASTSSSLRGVLDTPSTTLSLSSLSVHTAEGGGTVAAASEGTADVLVEPVISDQSEDVGERSSMSRTARNMVEHFQHNAVEDGVPLAGSSAETGTTPPPRTESDAALEGSVNNIGLRPNYGSIGETSQTVAETERSQPFVIRTLQDPLTSGLRQDRSSDDVALARQGFPSSDPISDYVSGPSCERSEDHSDAGSEAASRQDPIQDQAEGPPDAMQHMQPLRPMLTGPTDLDLLLARLDDPDFTFSGQSYDDLCLLEEIMGPALGTSTQLRARFEDVPLGKVEVLRRRVTKDGRTKLKLALLGVVVDKCGICLAQFKEDVYACLLPCHHAFHDNCLRLWMRRGETCPLCRGPLCSL